jgi:hypothetical protein
MTTSEEARRSLIVKRSGSSQCLLSFMTRRGAARKAQATMLRWIELARRTAQSRQSAQRWSAVASIRLGHPDAQGP